MKIKTPLFFSFSLKNFLTCFTSFGLAFSFVVLASLSVSKKPKDLQASAETALHTLPLVIIDAGHGGEDGGTASASGVLEKDINLQIALKLNAFLQLMGYPTLMVRTEDKMIYDGSPSTQREKKVSDIKNRFKLTEENPESIFLSIHQNYFSESRYSGAQVFYSPHFQQAENLAYILQNTIVSELQRENTRKIKASGKDIYLLYNAVVPAVMVECGFLSNQKEAVLLCEEKYQQKMALAIAKGLAKYVNSTEQTGD